MLHPNPLAHAQVRVRFDSRRIGGAEAQLFYVGVRQAEPACRCDRQCSPLRRSARRDDARLRLRERIRIRETAECRCGECGRSIGSGGDRSGAVRPTPSAEIGWPPPVRGATACKRRSSAWAAAPDLRRLLSLAGQPELPVAPPLPVPLLSGGGRFQMIGVAVVLGAALRRCERVAAESDRYYVHVLRPIAEVENSMVDIPGKFTLLWSARRHHRARMSRIWTSVCPEDGL